MTEPGEQPGRLTTNRLTVAATPEQVWDVLADGWLYPLWVVGATRVRAVDDGWPSVGSRIHHSVGVWPAVLNDTTEVVAGIRGRELRLKARGWPAGEADVVITLAPAGTATEVSLAEDVVAGPGAWVPGPLRAAALRIRNGETLRRLAFIAEGRSQHTRPSCQNPVAL